MFFLNQKPLLKIVIVLFGLIIVAGVFYYFFYYLLPVNYLIPGVPYFGFYNYFFDADSATITSTADILAYWGDNRFSVKYLTEYFSPSLPEGSAATTSPNVIYTTLDIQKFFKDNGYETYRWASKESGSEIKEIKKFVNSKIRIPVIVYQQILPETASTTAFRVVIGVFDDNQKVIVHDHNFGNNYEISYPVFQSLFNPRSRAILAVWPSDELKKSLKSPNYSVSYPQRLEAMDKLGPVLATKASQADYWRQLWNFKKSFDFYKEFIDDPNFHYFPPAYQVSFLSLLAGYYVQFNQFDEAINLIKNRVLPLNQNLDEPVLGWFIPPLDKFAWPYYWGDFIELYRVYCGFTP